MSDDSGGGAVPLRPVSGQAAHAAQPVPPPEHDDGTGLTPPRSKGGGSRFLSDVIAELGFLPRERVDAAVEEARATSRTPEQVLIDSGALTGDQLARAIAERFGLFHVDLQVYRPDLSAVNLISPQAARRFDAVPIGFGDDGALLVAMAEPANVLALDDLKLITGHEVRPAVASSDDIAGLIGRMSRLDDAVAEAVDEEEEDEGASITDIRESAEDAPVIKLVNSIIAQAVEDGASDIHFEPDGREMRVRFRVDGVLSETTTIPRRMVAGTVSRVKIMADLDISEKRVPQDGRVGLNVEGHTVDIRVVTMPSVHGEGIVMRILDKAAALMTLDKLGMAEERGTAVRGGVPPGLRRGAGHRPDRLGQVHDPLRRAERDQLDRQEHHHDRGPGRVPASGRQPAAGRTSRPG